MLLREMQEFLSDTGQAEQSSEKTKKGLSSRVIDTE